MERAAELEEKNRQLAESQEQSIRAEKMSVIGELTSSIAHELRNPLTVVGGFANLMLTAGDAGPNSEYLNIILTETKRAESAIHQVLDFSKASKTANRPIDFNLLVGQTFEMLLSKLKFSRRKPSLTMSDRTAEVFGNPDQLMHALFQFMWLTVEETTGECKITITTEIEEGVARMKIGFSGDESKRDGLVKILGQLFSSATGTQKLTMIVAGETVRCHGGNFGLEGTKDGFPTIYVELPRTERGTSGKNTDR
jgi:signal transduction histidine kinase